MMTTPIQTDLSYDTVPGIDCGTTAAFLQEVSWGSVIAGMAIALAIQCLLNLLGVGIGAAVLDSAALHNAAAMAAGIAAPAMANFTDPMAGFERQLRSATGNDPQDPQDAAISAIDAAQSATAAVSTGSILAFNALILGAAASWFGNATGTKRSAIVTTEPNCRIG